MLQWCWEKWFGQAVYGYAMLMSLPPNSKKWYQLGGVHLELWRYCGGVWDCKVTLDRHCPTLQPWMGWAKLVPYPIEKLFKRRAFQWIEGKTTRTPWLWMHHAKGSSQLVIDSGKSIATTSLNTWRNTMFRRSEADDSMSCAPREANSQKPKSRQHEAKCPIAHMCRSAGYVEWTHAVICNYNVYIQYVYIYIHMHIKKYVCIHGIPQ